MNHPQPHGFLAVPPAGNGAGVLVLHAWWGLNDTLEAALKDAGRPATFYRYSGTGHWFCEPDRAQAYNHAAASLAWDRTLAFLKGATHMSAVARGSFTVEIKPQAEPGTVEGVSLGRMSLHKRFEGDLVGTGQGEMLTALTPVQGSAGYVAIERVTGTLHGRSGSFVFQHSGIMDQGAQQLSISVVPGSGAGELAGIYGVFKLDIVDGRHLYEFEYSLP